jgi:hypothetical protein
LWYDGDIPFEARPTSTFPNNDSVHVNLIALVPWLYCKAPEKTS